MRAKRRSKPPVRAAHQSKNRSSVGTLASSSSESTLRSPSLTPPLSRHAIWVGLALSAVNLIVYGAVRHHDFVGWDDPDYVSQNPNVARGLTWPGVSWAFTSGYAANWHPLTWLSHMLDVQFYGMNAGPHLLTNLLLHIANTILLFGLLLWMTGALGRSAFVAGMFAVHPLHVESVAWVSERKDVLSTLFWMLTIWAYVAYVRQPRLSRYGLVLLLLGLGLMAKPMLVTLPFVLLLLDVWPLGRATLTPSPAWQRLVWEKVPLLALAAASSIVTFLVQQQGGAVRALEALPVRLRLANAAVSYVSYMGKMLWPARLATFYPFDTALSAWRVAGSIVILAGVSAMAMRVARRHAYVPVGWLWYLGTLVPVIGLVQVGGQSIADRYTYVPLIGLFIMVAWGLPDLIGGWRFGRVALPAAAGLAITASTVTAHMQVQHWSDTVALWSHAIEVTSGNYRAHSNLGNFLSDQGKVDEAIRHYQEALRINPNFVEAETNLANTLARQGRLDQAVEHYSHSLLIRPQYAGAHNGLGAILVDQGKVNDAIAHYREAIRLEPEFAEAHNNLAAALAQEGRVDEAVQEVAEALKIQPNSTEFRSNLDLLLKAKRPAAQR